MQTNISQLLPADVYQAAVNANTPSLANPFATMADIGGGGSSDLATVLTAGNTTADGQVIAALNGNAFLNLRNGADNAVRLQAGSDYIALGNSNFGAYGGDIATDLAFGSIIVNPAGAAISLFKSDFTKFGQISVIENSTADQNSGLIPNYPTVLSSQDYTVKQNVVNSVTLGGYQIIQKTNNTAYLNQLGYNKSNEGFELIINHTTPTADRTQTHQNADGIIALQIISISVSANHNAIANQLVLMTTGATDKTVTFPASPIKDDIIEVSKRDLAAGNCIVDGNGNLINGLATDTIQFQNTSNTYHFDGTNWIKK